VEGEPSLCVVLDSGWVQDVGKGHGLRRGGKTVNLQKKGRKKSDCIREDAKKVGASQT